MFISVSGNKNKIMNDSYFIGLTIMEPFPYPVFTLWTISSTFSFFPEVKELQWSYCVGSSQIYNKYIAVFFPCFLFPVPAISLRNQIFNNKINLSRE